MSLSARVVVEPSRLLVVLAASLPAAGVLVAATTMAAVWPGGASWIAAFAVIACGLLVLGASSRHRRSRPWSLSLATRDDFDVEPDPLGNDGSWRLADSTVIWPGFAMLALRKSDPSVGGIVVRRPVISAELDPDDRRSLNRFLLWSSRGGDGDRSGPRGRSTGP